MLLTRILTAAGISRDLLDDDRAGHIRNKRAMVNDKPQVLLCTDLAARRFCALPVFAPLGSATAQGTLLFARVLAKNPHVGKGDAFL